MMRSTIFGVALLLASTAGVQANDNRDYNVEHSTVPAPSITEEQRENLIAATYKRCLRNRADSIGVTKTYTVAETEEYCGCFSAKSIALATPEILAKAREINTGTWPESTKKDIDGVTKYCRDKYLNMPDVTKIKNRQW